MKLRGEESFFISLIVLMTWLLDQGYCRFNVLSCSEQLRKAGFMKVAQIWKDIDIPYMYTADIYHSMNESDVLHAIIRLQQLRSLKLAHEIYCSCLGLNWTLKNFPELDSLRLALTKILFNPALSDSNSPNYYSPVLTPTNCSIKVLASQAESTLKSIILDRCVNAF